MTKTNLVIGCGVIGLTTALELLRRGESVTLIDSHAHEGLGTSFANAGLLTPSMADPWNAPGVHRHLLEYLVSSSSAFKLRLRALPSLTRWGLRFLLNSRAEPYRRATLANLELSTYSLAVLKDMRGCFGLAFDSADRGTLKFFRSEAAADAAVGVTHLLEQHGLAARFVDRNGAVDIEPRLAPIRQQIAGAVFYPEDASGDAHLFCRAVARAVSDLGGTFRYGSTARAIAVTGGRVTGVKLDNEVVEADHVIIATGVTSPALASGSGLRLAIKPVKGYSMTYKPDPAGPMPRIPIVDDAYHAAITPLGSRLRVAGTAEFAGRDLRLDKRRIDNLDRLFQAAYPELATEVTRATGQPWAGLRPMSADGVPYIGPAPLSGLWINSGHGHLGWTLAAGSARLLADLMTGRKPEVDGAAFAPNR